MIVFGFLLSFLVGVYIGVCVKIAITEPERPATKPFPPLPPPDKQDR
jgi:hypothetical protein